jgi:hypothetical protein
VGARADLLKAEIEKAKNDLAGHLAELKIEGRAAGRRAATRTGAAIAVLGLAALSFVLIRSILRRHRS